MITPSRFLFLLGFFLWSCASIQAPQGGPKDEKPPQLIGSKPVNGQTGFSEKSIALDFNENVTENNSKQLFLSPQTVTTTKPSNKRLKIVPDSGFKINTTYTLRLNGKIKDEREGTAMKDTTLLFSTGSSIDTICLETNHLDLSNKPSNGKRLVQLIDTLGTIYFGEGDTKEKIKVSGLHNGWYDVFSFTDGNENYKYEDSDGPLFFDKIKVDSNRLMAIKTLPHQSKPIQLFKQIRGDTLSIEGSAPFTLGESVQENIVYQSLQKDKYRLFPLRQNLLLEVIDSMGNCKEDTINLTKIDSTRSFELAENSPKVHFEKLKKTLSLQIKYAWKIKVAPKKAEINFDSVWTEVPLESSSTSVKLLIAKPKEGKMKIRFDSIGFYNKTGFKLDSLVLASDDFATPGEISGQIESETNQVLVVELLEANGKWISSSKGKNFLFQVKPGKYRIQCFVDWNGDGLYTGGNFLLNRKAEPLFQSSEIVELKPGWDIENLKFQPGF